MYKDILDTINNDKLKELIAMYENNSYKTNRQEFFTAVVGAFNNSTLIRNNSESTITASIQHLHNTKAKLYTLKKLYLEDIIETLYSDTKHEYSKYLLLFIDNPDRTVHLKLDVQKQLISNLSDEVTQLYSVLGIKGTLELLICTYM